MLCSQCPLVQVTSAIPSDWGYCPDQDKIVCLSGTACQEINKPELSIESAAAKLQEVNRA